jgi:hypothetical protein
MSNAMPMTDLWRLHVAASVTCWHMLAVSNASPDHLTGLTLLQSAQYDAALHFIRLCAEHMAEPLLVATPGLCFT